MPPSPWKFASSGTIAAAIRRLARKSFAERSKASRARNWNEGPVIMQPNPIIALRDEQLRAAGGAEDARPLVRLKAGELHNLATEAENLLIDAGAPFYSRGAALVRPVVDE